MTAELHVTMANESRQPCFTKFAFFNKKVLFLYCLLARWLLGDFPATVTPSQLYTNFNVI